MNGYDLRAIMTRAWELYRAAEDKTFAECLHTAWQIAKAAPVNAQRIREARTAAGVTEECKTWSEWKKDGFEVIHGSKALFGVDLIWASKGDGAIYKARFFGASQVQKIEKAA